MQVLVSVNARLKITYLPDSLDAQEGRLKTCLCEGAVILYKNRHKLYKKDSFEVKHAVSLSNVSHRALTYNDSTPPGATHSLGTKEKQNRIWLQPAWWELESATQDRCYNQCDRKCDQKLML